MQMKETTIKQMIDENFWANEHSDQQIYISLIFRDMCILIKSLNSSDEDKYIFNASR